MLSKARGQILRITAVLHVLFHWKTPQEIPDILSESALKAAINFVDLCNKHAAILAGRGDIEEAIESVQHIQSGLVYIC